MAFSVPSVADFKSRFDRDFPYCVADQSDRSKLRDVDVTRGLTLARANFNAALFSDDDLSKEAFLLLSAHYVVTNIQASSQGLGGAGQWLTASKGVGPLAESYNIPERILRSPALSLYSKTTYGALYLSILAPYLVGNVAVVCGGTPPV